MAAEASSRPAWLQEKKTSDRDCLHGVLWTSWKVFLDCELSIRVDEVSIFGWRFSMVIHLYLGEEGEIVPFPCLLTHFPSLVLMWTWMRQLAESQQKVTGRSSLEPYSCCSEKVEVCFSQRPCQEDAGSTFPWVSGKSLLAYLFLFSSVSNTCKFLPWFSVADSFDA